MTTKSKATKGSGGRRAEASIHGTDAAPGQTLEAPAQAHTASAAAGTSGNGAVAGLASSAAILRPLTDSNIIGIIRATYDGRITEANDAFLSLVGYTREELVSGAVSWAEMTPPEYRALDAQKIDEARRRGSATPWEKEYVRKDGSRVPILIGFTALEGSTDEVVAFVLDISERRRAESEVAASNQRVQTILESITDAFLALDREWRFTYVNGQAEQMLRRRREELLGRNVWEEFPQAVGSTFERQYRRAVAEQAAVSFEEFFPPLDTWFEVTAYPSRDGLSVYFRNVNERKRIEAELHEQKETLEAISRVGQMLAAELDLHKIVQAVTDAATEVTGARFGSFFYNVLDERGASYMLYTLSGVPREAFAHFPMPRATDLFGPTFRGEGVLRLADVRRDSRYGRNSPYYGMPEGHLPVTSYLAVPVISRAGEVLGGLFFGHPEEAAFTERHERLVVGFAAQAAVAMDNARLFEQAARARAQAETARQRAAFLAEASEMLAASLDYETTLVSLARLAVPRLADWCGVDMLDADGRIRRLAVAHVDVSKVELAHELDRRYPPDPRDAEGLPKVLRTGRSELYTEIPDGLLAAVARDETHLSILRQLGLKSGLIVPLVARGRTLGAITLVMDESGRRFTEADLPLAEDLARRAAVAVDNASLYRRTQEAAAALKESEERYRSLVLATSQLVWTTDAAGQVVDIPGWRELTGQSVEEVRGRGWLDAIHPEDRARVAAAWDEAFAGKSHYDVEYRLRSRDGSYRDVAARGVPIIGEDGRLREWVGTVTDITERKRAQAELRASEQRYRALTDAMPQLVWATDEHGSHFYYNQRWYDYTGLTAEESLGFGFVDALDPEDRERTLRAWERAWRDGEGYEIEYRFHSRPRHETRWFLGRAVPVRDETGRITQWVGTCTDIEEQKQMEEQLARLSEERERRLEEVSTPVVPVLPGVLVLPLIGSLDALRMERATRAALGEVTRTGARACIIDITGARIIDSSAVANLTNLVASLRLVGAEAFVTGIGAQAARSLVGLGLDLSEMHTYRTLAQALDALGARRNSINGKPDRA